MEAVNYIKEGQIDEARLILVNKVVKWFYETSEPTDQAARTSFWKARWWTEEAVRHIEQGSEVYAREALEKIVIPWFEQIGTAVVQSQPIQINQRDTIFVYINQDKATIVQTQATAIAQVETAVQARIATAQAQVTATAQAQATATVQAILATRPLSKVVTVYANKDWQETGIFVLEGETVSIRYVAGSWRHCPPGCPDSQGDGAPGAPQNYPENVLQACTHFKLIARISNSTLCTGVHYTGIAQTSGILQLRANDTRVGDNAGQIVVQIEVK